MHALFFRAAIARCAVFVDNLLFPLPYTSRVLPSRIPSNALAYVPRRSFRCDEASDSNRRSSSCSNGDINDSSCCEKSLGNSNDLCKVRIGPPKGGMVAAEHRRNAFCEQQPRQQTTCKVQTHRNACETAGCGSMFLQGQQNQLLSTLSAQDTYSNPFGRYGLDGYHSVSSSGDWEKYIARNNVFALKMPVQFFSNQAASAHFSPCFAQVELKHSHQAQRTRSFITATAPAEHLEQQHPKDTEKESAAEAYERRRRKTIERERAVEAGEMPEAEKRTEQINGGAALERRQQQRQFQERATGREQQQRKNVQQPSEKSASQEIEQQQRSERRRLELEKQHERRYQQQQQHECKKEQQDAAEQPLRSKREQQQQPSKQQRYQQNKFRQQHQQHGPQRLEMQHWQRLPQHQQAAQQLQQVVGEETRFDVSKKEDEQLLKRVGEEKTKHVGPRPIYLDYQATTIVDPRVVDAMLPYMYDIFGNPHSSSHSLGWEANAAVEKAREQVAALLGLEASRAREIIFTSGATESNNLAIKGAVNYYCKPNYAVQFNKCPNSKPRERRHIITTQLEHKCLLQCCRQMLLQYREGSSRKEAAMKTTEGGEGPATTGGGCDVTFLKVNSDGLLDLSEVAAAIRPDTLLLSVMHVNNEIGVVQNLQALSEICKKHDILFHTDAAQSAGKLPLDVDELGVDMLSLSAHKLYGPKGIGALFLRLKKPRVRLTPIIDGGGQERGLRSGTLATPLCVGFGAACEVAQNEMANDQRHIEYLAQLLLNTIREKIPDVQVNGSLQHRYCGNLNISFTFVEGESLIMSIPGLAVSSGSACTSASLEPSYVLRALGVGEEVAHTSLRFGIGRFTRESDVRLCAEHLVKEVARLRELSPLYELEMTKRKVLSSGLAPHDESEGPALVWT